MGIVDIVMVGHLPDSARAIGSVSISSNLFNMLAFFGGGLRTADLSWERWTPLRYSTLEIVSAWVTLAFA